ncbi:asparagine synthase (glutamine-hydrolyzing) [Candidatus Methylospira mobilis]|uniref:asparagine synthase (glutamine-hydrolyzing) n=1 Tax=Candidatus Methylospira mobilis TaxID=1808979 RepID=A0A5Q0BHY3_9GAMM|nr:asparagine synthase (glutamine-hydrolyzing) [Candidatus Methylospira mobilis]QFY41738.1 asparagine synthase (glutamine-hydrolyzing) [Candidatus Methylospira mobilis]WNV06595.1 asparagine synthase (glutamine-hydrolyzing) [Candidatus Methylospira mobilis]
MCGVCGIAQLSGALNVPEARRQVEQMVALLAHRGPDGSGISTGNDAVLGATRLAIRGLADGDQPFVDSESGVTVACNGEIDNHLEIRDWLAKRGRQVEHATDVAVIPQLYLELGDRFPEKLVGAFAIVIWDPRCNTLILARDRAGERPLYYRQQGANIAFASELTALTASGAVSASPDINAIAGFLRFGYFPAPTTPLEHIHAVGPAEVICFTVNGTQRRNYWSWPLTATSMSPLAPAARERALSDFDTVFRNAVLQQSEVDVDFGVFLSGGVDSSLVAAVTRNLRPEKRLNAYSLRFSESSYDEGDIAEGVANSLGVEFIPVWIKPEDFPAMLPELMRVTGIPLADPAWIPSTLLAKRAAQDVKVALVGEGADELFGGYPTYFGARFALYYSRLPAALRRLIRISVDRWPATDKKVTLSFLLKRFIQGDTLSGLERHRLWVSNIAPELLHKLGVQHHFSDYPAESDSLLNQVQRFDLENSLAEGLLTKADRSGMTQGLELRAPFLDLAVMEFAGTLPEAERTRGISTKIFLKSYAMRYLPKEIVYRRKRGLSVPLSSWLRGPLADWASNLLNEPRLEQAGVNRKAARDLFNAHRKRQGDHARALWTLMVLSAWLSTQA